MGHRVIGVLLSSTMLFLASVPYSCPAASCPMMKQGRVDCCHHSPGITAPSCCSGHIEGVTTPAALATGRRSVGAAPATLSKCVADLADPMTALDGPVRQRSQRALLPLDGTLLDQLTSLVL